MYLTVEEAAELARTNKNTFYQWLANTGAQGGTPKKRFPPELYVHFGRKVLFKKEALIDWINSGAKFID